MPRSLSLPSKSRVSGFFGVASTRVQEGEASGLLQEFRFRV